MKQLTQQILQTITSVALLLLSTGTLAASDTKSVLMVLSGYGQQAGEAAPGYEFDEFSKAYLVFKHNDVAVDIVSPQGGKIEADTYDPDKPYNAAVLADDTIMAKLTNTLSIASVNAKQYDGMFIVGGKGAMFDLPKDESLQQLIADIYQQRGSVAAVCHGPAAIVNVKLDDGSYLVADKAVNGFTNEEEKLFGKKWINEFDFMLEDKLVERGGKFQSSDIMLSHVAVDGRLITGQNPSSTVAVATELVKSMGIESKPMAVFKDDATLALVALLLAGDNKAKQTLLASQEQYNIPLVGMYGYYYLNTADSDNELKNALELMSLAKETINNPRLDLQIAKVQHRVGETKKAIDTLHQLLASTPDFKPAIEMLETLTL